MPCANQTIQTRGKDVVHLYRTAQASQSSQYLAFDPRTKLYALVVLNVILFSTNAGDTFSALKLFLAVLPFLGLLNAKKVRSALGYALIYLAFSQFAFLMQFFGGNALLALLIRIGNEMATRVFPCTFFAYAVLSSTAASEFMAAMKKLRVPLQLTIPCAIVFRFLSTVVEEYKDIQSAMRLRGITFARGPVAMLEYRLIPLMISVVKIGEELTAAALTRGLSVERNRTCFCEIRLKMQDILLFALMTGALFVFICGEVL